LSEPRTVRRTFTALVLIGFIARLSYGMARTPLLALFARSLGASSAAIGLAVGMSTVTGIFKAPAGTLSDVSGGGLAQQFEAGGVRPELGEEYMVRGAYDHGVAVLGPQLHYGLDDGFLHSIR